MDKQAIPIRIIQLSKYYAFLQIFHVLFLARAGLIFILQGEMPFPAQPPPGGWVPETIPFMFGMGFMDALAAGIAIYAGWMLIKRDHYQLPLWIISIHIALSSAVVYCFGTMPSGAWLAHPIGYGIVALLFSPLIFLFIYLVRFWVKSTI
jgi:hypothetical protein